jgi:hypothetical protein
MTKRIYLASSWKNTYQPEVISWLRDAAYEVYNYRQPQEQGPLLEDTPEAGFDWRNADPTWGPVTSNILERYKRMLGSPIAKAGFKADYEAMRWADTCVLVLPSGRSAHLEAGWMAGSGRRLVVYMPPAVDASEPNTLVWSFEPELMYLLGGDPNLITTSKEQLLERLSRRQPQPLYLNDPVPW